MRRWQQVVVAVLILAIGAAGVGLVRLADNSDETASKVDATATRAAAEPSHRAAADAQLRAELARAAADRDRLRAELAREAVERERLRQLVIASGGDPGPDLDVTVVAPQPSSAPSSPPARASPAPSPSPSPTCRRLPLVGCPLKE